MPSANIDTLIKQGFKYIVYRNTNTMSAYQYTNRMFADSSTMAMLTLTDVEIGDMHSFGLHNTTNNTTTPMQMRQATITPASTVVTVQW